MVTYFNYFPKTMYNGKKVVDITKKVNMVSAAKKDITLLKPYTVMDGEKPEDIAFYYYGSIDYYWLILMTNDMLNYYEDWVMDSNTFEKYIMTKYKEQSGNKTGYDIIAWTMNETLLDNVLYFVDKDGKIFSKDTIIIDNVPQHDYKYLKSVTGQKYIIETYLNKVMDVRPFRIYEYEYLNNEQKRNILLIDSTYVTKVLSDFVQKIGE